jgi:peptidoglycan/LPS O-acetylase OafA/YrhL
MSELKTADRSGTRDYVGIQVLRFVAAALVVGLHATFIVHDRMDATQTVWSIGWIGVPIFFVISGFVMVVSSQRLVGTPSGWREFLMRRGVRIVPLYWIATTIQLVALLVVPALLLHDKFGANRIALSYLLLPSRNSDGVVAPLVGVGWTLLFEAFFYLVFALSLRLRVSPVWFCGAVLSIAAVGWLVRPVGDWPPVLVYFDPVVLHFLGGILIGTYAINRRLRPLIVGLAFVVGLYLSLWALAPEGATSRSNAAYLPIALVVVLLALAVQRWSDRVPGLLRRLGDASYSLYLFHPILAPAIPVVMIKFGLIEPGVAVAAIMVAMSVASLAIHKYVERPITRSLQARLRRSAANPRRGQEAVS